jgi:hypothetical protein
MKTLLRKNTSNQFVPGNKPYNKTWMAGEKQNSQEQRCFSQFCEVGGLSIVNKRKRPNLAGNTLESLLSFDELYECTISIWKLQTFFPQNMATLAYFFHGRKR